MKRYRFHPDAAASGAAKKSSVEFGWDERTIDVGATMAKETKALLVRMNDDIHGVLDRLADELQLSKAEIVRRAVQALAGQRAIVVGDDRVALTAMAESLRAIGTNLNQIARRLNASGEVDANTLGAVLARLIDVNAATRTQIQELTGQTRQRMIAGVSPLSSAAP